MQEIYRKKLQNIFKENGDIYGISPSAFWDICKLLETIEEEAYNEGWKRGWENGRDQMIEGVSW